MEIILYIYFAVNLFLAGYWFNENDKWESRGYAVVFSSVCFFFGGLACLVYLFYILFSPILIWITHEVRFQYKFYFTKYWQGIMPADKNKTAEEKIQEIKKITETSSKQMARHAKKVYNKFKY